MPQGRSKARKTPLRQPRKAKNQGLCGGIRPVSLHRAGILSVAMQNEPCYRGLRGFRALRALRAIRALRALRALGALGALWSHKRLVTNALCRFLPPNCLISTILRPPG